MMRGAEGNEAIVGLVMFILIPSKKICKDFSLVYELEGAQKAADLLARYYKVRRMKIIIDGRKVGRKSLGFYLDNKSYFKRNSLRRRIILHEFYHHLVYNRKVVPEKEESEADNYAKTIINQLR
jgi:hypothetical protein